MLIWRAIQRDQGPRQDQLCGLSARRANDCRDRHRSISRVHITGPVTADLWIVGDEPVWRAVGVDRQGRAEPDAEGEAGVAGFF